MRVGERRGCGPRTRHATTLLLTLITFLLSAAAAARAIADPAAADSLGSAPDTVTTPPPPASDSTATPPPPARADSAAARRDTVVTRHSSSMVDTVTVLPPVVVEATKRADPGRSTATQVRLERSRLIRFLPSTASDALLSVPGVDLVKTGPWASRISVRGLSGDRVLVLVDGVRVNGVRGHGAQSSLVALDRLDAVEMNPGAGSARYGSDALGGVVEFVTHRPLLDSPPVGVMTLQARGAMPGTGWAQSARMRVKGRNLGFELCAGIGGLGSLTTPQGSIPNSGNREQNGSARIVGRLAGVTADYEHASNDAFDVGLPAFSDDNGSTGIYPLQSRDVDRFELSQPGGGAWPQTNLLASLQNSHTRFTETTVAPYVWQRRVIGTVTTDAADRVATRTATMTPTLVWPALAGLRLNGEYRREDTSGPRNTVTTTRMTSGAVTDVTPATFVAPTVKTMRIEGGLRWDHMQSHADSTVNSSTSRLDVTDEQLSGEAGLARRFGAFEPYAHLATGFRAPNLEERYYHDEIHGGMTVFGNPDLVSERSRSAEVGLRLRDFHSLSEARVSAYRSNVHDLIGIEYLDLLYGRPRFQYRNIREARLEGVEATIALRFGAVALGLNGSLPRGTNLETNQRLTDAGTARAVADLMVPLPRVIPNGTFSVRWRWNDAVHGVDSTLARPAFSTTALELATMIRGFRAVLAVRNLLNYSYREPLSFIPESGRVFAISLRRDFGFAVPFARKEP